MSDEQKPPFTSERDRVADAHSFSIAEDVALKYGTLRDVMRESFSAGADWGHARASEENAALNYRNEEWRKMFDRERESKLEYLKQLAASQAREEGLRAALARIADNVDRNEFAWECGEIAREALAAHGGGEKDDGR